MKRTAIPFRQAPESAVDHSGWTIADASGEQPLPLDVPHWDYQTTLNLLSAVSVKRTDVLQHCQLGPASALAVAVIGRSDHTGARGLLSCIAVPPQDTYDIAVEIELPGHSLGGRLDLETMLILQEADTPGPLGPRRPGSILWRTRHRAHLEGTASRFPTDTSDFTRTRPTLAHAAWHLHVDATYPDVAFMAAVRLTLNTGSPLIERMLSGPGDAEARRTLAVLRWDVTRQLVMHALRLEEVDDAPADHEDSTLAGVLRSLLAVIWPHDPPSALRERLARNPELLEIAIQHHVRLTD